MITEHLVTLMAMTIETKIRFELVANVITKILLWFHHVMYIIIMYSAR